MQFYTAWEGLCRLMKKQGVIPKTSDSIKAERFRQSFAASRTSHKNYKIKTEQQHNVIQHIIAI
jgi:hypothetical protein